jgi:flavin-binding protein dodecin
MLNVHHVGRLSRACRSGMSHRQQEDHMAEHVYRVLDLVGSSDKSIEDAVTTAIDRANKTIRNLRWFEIGTIRGDIENGKVRWYQVEIKVGFTMEDPKI